MYIVTVSCFFLKAKHFLIKHGTKYIGACTVTPS